MKRILIFLSCLLMVAACGRQTAESQKKGSSGKTLEVLLVADKNIYNGDTKELIDSLFRRPQLGMMQVEPIFDVVNIPVSSYKNSEMFRVHRNVILCDVNPENPNKVYKHVDQFAAPQIVYDFVVKDRATLNEFIEKYQQRIIDDIYETEHRRMYKVFKSNENTDIRVALKKQIGIELTAPTEFVTANPNNPTPDFAWIRKETKDFGIGVLIHTTPYQNQNQFTQDNILDTLDTLMRHHVPCSVADSYMGTERRLDSYTKTVTIGASPYAVETRGCWRAFGDFMGGPYVNYTLLSPDKKQVITLTGYVYYPSDRIKNMSKRDLLMQVEGICHSVVFN